MALGVAQDTDDMKAELRLLKRLRDLYESYSHPYYHERFVLAASSLEKEKLGSLYASSTSSCSSSTTTSCSSVRTFGWIPISSSTAGWKQGTGLKYRAFAACFFMRVGLR